MTTNLSQPLPDVRGELLNLSPPPIGGGGSVGEVHDPEPLPASVRHRLDDPRVIDTIRAAGRTLRMDEQARDDYPSWALLQAVHVARKAPTNLDREAFHAYLYNALRTMVLQGNNLRDLGRRGDKGAVVLISADLVFGDGETRLHFPDTGADPLVIILRREHLEHLLTRLTTEPPPPQTALCPECLTRPPEPRCAGYCNACKIRLRMQTLGTCTEHGCEKPQRARGLCRWHYDRARKAQKETTTP